MHDPGQRAESIEQRGGGRIEEFVGDTEDASSLHGAQAAPSALGDDALQGHAIASAAPGHDNDLRISRGDFLGRGLAARLADELAAGGSHQLGHPALRMDDGLAPLLAENSRAAWPRGAGGAHPRNLSLNASDNLCTAPARAHNAVA